MSDARYKFAHKMTDGTWEVIYKDGSMVKSEKDEIVQDCLEREFRFWIGDKLVTENEEYPGIWMVTGQYSNRNQYYGNCSVYKLQQIIDNPWGTGYELGKPVELFCRFVDKEFNAPANGR